MSNRSLSFYLFSAGDFVLQNRKVYNDFLMLFVDQILLYYQQSAVMQSSRVTEISGTGQQNNWDRPEPSSAQILQTMKKKPFTQLIHGVEYTYSILSKKQQTFVLTNERFLVLKSIESISYARSFPENRALPFTNIAQLPQFKNSFRISEIETYTNEQERLIIQFSGKNKVKWEFVCPTKVCALEWRKKLDKATQTLQDFQQSKFNKYEEYLENKKKEELKLNQFTDMKSLMGSAVHQSQPSISNISQSSIHPINPVIASQALNIVNPLANQNPPNQQNLQESKNQPQLIIHPPPNLIKKPQETIINNQTASEQKRKDDNLLALLTAANEPSSQSIVENHNASDKPKDLKPFVAYIETNIKEKQKIQNPNGVLFSSSHIAKVENFIIDGKIEQDLIDRSMVSIPTNEKELMKTNIANLRRNWIEELLAGGEEGELILGFKNYAQKVAEVIINELYVPQELKIYPVNTSSNLFAAYLLEDVEIQIYFYSEEHLASKNPKYKEAVTQFKNFDYLLGCLKNEGILRVPFMTLFQYKGFLGMAKTRLGQNLAFRNKELYAAIDRKQFERATRVSASVLLSQTKCKIVAYEKQSALSKMIAGERLIFFTEYLSQFLPLADPRKAEGLLRPEFVQDEELQDDLFRDEVYQVKVDRVDSLITRKIIHLVTVLESGDDYFTNSKELSEIFHYYGLNIRHIGAVYRAVRQSWLRNILRAEMAARCAKNFFRLDIQNSVLANLDKASRRQRQEERERNRVISFLNIVFGNTETTFRIWRNFNNAALQFYGVNVWENQFKDINLNYFLQAIQTNFKIILANNIHQKQVFKNMNSFEPRDFVRFEFDITIYDLEFTEVFDEIHECLEAETLQSFHHLCQILIDQTSAHIPYLQLLKNHPIHDKISQFLLNFTSPEENEGLYRRIQANHFPTRFTFESKLAEIKWYLKSDRHDSTYKPFSFIEEHTKKWLGNVHPLFTQINRILAEYYLQLKPFYQRALKHAQASLQMQRLLYEGDSEPLWKDYFLIAKIHYENGQPEQALKFLQRGKQLVKIQRLNDMEAYGEFCLMLARCYIGVREPKLAYSTVKELYSIIREERDEKSLSTIIECVVMMKQLLQLNQEHESYYRFIESDFSQIMGGFAEYPPLIHAAIKLIAVPSLKNVVLNNGKNRGSILMIIDQISKIPQNYHSCLSYLRTKTLEGLFPKTFLGCLKEIDGVIEEIEKNEMVDRWINFNKLANQSLLEKIGGSQIYRGFEFLACLTALFHLLGEEAHRQLFIMEK